MCRLKKRINKKKSFIEKLYNRRARACAAERERSGCVAFILFFSSLFFTIFFIHNFFYSLGIPYSRQKKNQRNSIERVKHADERTDQMRECMILLRTRDASTFFVERAR